MNWMKWMARGKESSMFYTDTGQRSLALKVATLQEVKLTPFV
jgi:hypothetical protein